MAVEIRQRGMQTVFGGRKEEALRDGTGKVWRRKDGMGPWRRIGGSVGPYKDTALGELERLGVIVREGKTNGVDEVTSLQSAFGVGFCFIFYRHFCSPQVQGRNTCLTLFIFDNFDILQAARLKERGRHILT